MRKLILFFFYFLCLTHLYSQSNFFYEHGHKIEEYGPNEGVRNTEVAGIIQDKKGFIWLASMNNLIRFDGTNFQYFPLSKDVKLNNRYDLLFNLYEDQEGNLWLNAQGDGKGGLLKFDPIQETFERFQFNTNTQAQIVQLETMEYVVALKDSLYQLILTDTFELVPIDLDILGLNINMNDFHPNFNKNDFSKRIKNIHLFQDKKEQVWIEAYGKFGKLYVENGTFKFHNFSNYTITKDSTQFRLVWSINGGNKEHLWLINSFRNVENGETLEVLLTKFDQQTGAFEDYTITSIRTPDPSHTVSWGNIPKRVLEDKGGNLWLIYVCHA